MNTNETLSVRRFLKPLSQEEVGKRLKSVTKKKKNKTLIDAANNGDVAAVRLLLEAGADVHAKGGEALHLAAEEGHTEVVRLLKHTAHTLSAQGMGASCSWWKR